MNRYDVVVIGGGAAGLSAALVLSRARRTVLAVDAGQPRNAPAAHMHGFLSRDGLAPAELLATGRNEVAGYGGSVFSGVVTDLVPDGRTGFWVLLGDRQRVSTRRLLVTTGLCDELPEIAGLTGRWARDVLHCPYCHGHEVRDRQLGVIGGAPGSVRYAQIVRQWTHDLVYFTPPGTLTAVDRTELLARAIGVVEGTIKKLVIDDDQLWGVQLDDGRVIPRDALFVPPRFVPNNALLLGLGATVDSDGWVEVDPSGRTSVPGVWAAGNVVDPRAQVITAAGAGSASAIALNADLVDDDVRNAVRDLKHGFPASPPLDHAHEGVTMTNAPSNPADPRPLSAHEPASGPAKPGPPTKHQVAVMIWVAVFPTLTVLNLALGHWLATLTPVLRTFVLATIAVPIVIYGLMPQLHRLRGRLLTRLASTF